MVAIDSDWNNPLGPSGEGAIQVTPSKCASRRDRRRRQGVFLGTARVGDLGERDRNPRSPAMNASNMCGINVATSTISP